MAPTLLIGPAGWAPLVPPVGGGGGGGGGGPTTPRTPTPDGLWTGPNGLGSALPTRISDLANYTPGGGALTLSAPQGLKQLAINGRIINHLGNQSDVLSSCAIYGSPSNVGNIVDCTSSSTGVLVVQDTLIQPKGAAIAVGVTGIIGAKWTARRVEVLNTVDGFGAYNIAGQPNADFEMDFCLAHLLAGFLNDPGQKNNGVSPGPSHNDCLQYQGGNNGYVHNCTLLGFVDPTVADGASWNAGTATSLNGGREFGPALQVNSCIQTNQNNGKPITSGFRVENNYFDGGAPASVNIAWNSLNTKVIVDTFIGNRFGRNQGGAPAQVGDNTYTVLATTGHAQILVQSGNVYDDTGAPVNVRVA